ncbi:S41 family peptidase [Kosmotoga pacifica]|uniref:Tail specific protease domain-containing protein n=1 Tax=Kosmotoga pacifica TaxID=1330330 RepID=A0A0G2Z5K1_9BACT|nr:S41 family peptidase [Kosmotoga pacifica]AKI96895.1 hypothetical protein IX53_02625 [Kosmotoga pacifica]
MNKISYILIGIFLIVSTFTIAERFFTPEQLREDLDFLVSRVIENYYDPWYKVNEDEFWDLVAKKRAQLDHELTWLEFYKIATPLISILHDQHSFLSPPRGVEIKVFPFRMRRVNGHAVVVDSICELPLGSVVTKVNDIPIESIIEALEIYGILETTESRLNWLTNFFFQALPEWWGIEKFEITYLYEDEEKTLKIETTNAKDYKWVTQPARKRSPSFELHGSIGILKIPSFDRSFQREIIDRMEEALDSHIIDLVIDVRANAGGFIEPVISLLGYFVDKPTELAIGIGSKSHTREGVKFTVSKFNVHIYPAVKLFSGRLWILTDENVFSANLLFLGFLSREGIGTILGERSSETANFGSQWKGYLLPNTKCGVNISSIRIFLLEEGMRIEPDIPIILSLEEKISWLIGKSDPMLDEALRIVERASGEQNNKD